MSDGTFISRGNRHCRLFFHSLTSVNCLLTCLHRHTWLADPPPCPVMWQDHMRKHFLINISLMVFNFISLPWRPASCSTPFRRTRDPILVLLCPAGSTRYHGARVGGQHFSQQAEMIMVQVCFFRGQVRTFWAAGTVCSSRHDLQQALWGAVSRPWTPPEGVTHWPGSVSTSQEIKLYCGGRRMDQSEGSIQTDAASSD